MKDAPTNPIYSFALMYVFAAFLPLISFNTETATAAGLGLVLPEGMYSAMGYAVWGVHDGISVAGLLGVVAFVALWLSTRTIVPELRIQALAYVSWSLSALWLAVFGLVSFVRLREPTVLVAGKWIEEHATEVVQPDVFGKLQALFAPHTAVEDVVTFVPGIAFLVVAQNLYKLLQEMRTADWDK